MNAVRYAAFATAETLRPSDSRSATAPLKARPRKRPRSFDEMRGDASKRFSNIFGQTGEVTEPVWLPVAEIIETNRYEVAKTGEPHFLRDLGMLVSAIEKPKNLYYYGGETDIVALACALLFAIARNHPFEQGNKRTGFQSAFQFLDLNGYDLAVPNIDEVADFIDSVVARKNSEEQFVEEVRRYVMLIEE